MLILPLNPTAVRFEGSAGGEVSTNVDIVSHRGTPGDNVTPYYNGRFNFLESVGRRDFWHFDYGEVIDDRC